MSKSTSPKRTRPQSKAVRLGGMALPIILAEAARNKCTLRETVEVMVLQWSNHGTPPIAEKVKAAKAARLAKKEVAA